MADQVLFGTDANNLDTGTVRFIELMGGTTWNATENQRFAIMPTGGEFKNLRIELNGAPGSGKSWTFVLMVDGSASALSVTISDSATSGNDTSNVVAVTAGQTVSLRVTPSGTPASSIKSLRTLVFAGTEAKESIILGNTAIILSAGSTEYVQVSNGTGNGPGTTESDFQQLCACAGNLKKLYVRLTANPGVDPDAYTFKARKNGLDTGIQVDIVGAATTGNDTVNTVSIAAGDLLSIEITPVSVPAATPSASWGMAFLADVDGESPVIAGTERQISVSAARYAHINVSNGFFWNGNENLEPSFGQVCTLRDLYVNLVTAPGSGKSYVLQSRVNQLDGNMAVTISDTATTGNDQVNSDTLTTGDEASLKCTPSGIPTITAVRFGYVQFIAPTVPTVTRPGGSILQLMGGQQI